jgi:beta-lactam-binding protein with PASTA domain
VNPESLYNLDMRIASGRVVGGRVELDADLPEGASVTVLVMEGDETFEADSGTEKMLLEAIAQCRRNGTTPMAQFLDELRRNE